MMQKRSSFVQYSARHAIVRHKRTACRVVMADDLVALVVLRSIGRAITKSLYNSILLSDCNRPEQIVVVGPSLKTPPIPAIQQLVCLPEQHEPPACIDTVGEQRLAGRLNTCVLLAA